MSTTVSTELLHPTSQTFDEQVLSSPVPVLVDFSATWCPPCRMQKPVVESIARQAGDSARVAVVDVDESPELAGRYNVSSIPALMIVANGQVVARWNGLTPQGTLLKGLRDAGASL